MTTMRPTEGREDNGWTPRGMVMVGLMAVLAAVLILSHFGVSVAVLLGVSAIGVLSALIVLYRLPGDANGGREGRDG
jgi:hypothetical protein